jgi:hypothetical protein
MKKSKLITLTKVFSKAWKETTPARSKYAVRITWDADGLVVRSTMGFRVLPDRKRGSESPWNAYSCQNLKNPKILPWENSEFRQIRKNSADTYQNEGADFTERTLSDKGGVKI